MEDSYLAWNHRIFRRQPLFCDAGLISVLRMDWYTFGFLSRCRKNRYNTPLFLDKQRTIPWCFIFTSSESNGEDVSNDFQAIDYCEGRFPQIPPDLTFCFCQGTYQTKQRYIVKFHVKSRLKHFFYLSWQTKKVNWTFTTSLRKARRSLHVTKSGQQQETKIWLRETEFTKTQIPNWTTLNRS